MENLGYQLWHFPDALVPHRIHRQAFAWRRLQVKSGTNDLPPVTRLDAVQHNEMRPHVLLPLPPKNLMYVRIL